MTAEDMTDNDLCRAIATLRGLRTHICDPDYPLDGWRKDADSKFQSISYCANPTAAWELLIWAIRDALPVKNENPSCHGFDGRCRITFEFFSNYWMVTASVEPEPPSGDEDIYDCGNFREGNGIENPMRALAEAVYNMLIAQHGERK